MSERTAARPHTQRVVSAIRYIYKSKITILPPPPPPPSRYRRHRRHRHRCCPVLGGPVMNVCSATISAAPGIVHRTRGPTKPFYAHGDAVSLVSMPKRPFTRAIRGVVRNFTALNITVKFDLKRGHISRLCPDLIKINLLGRPYMDFPKSCSQIYRLYFHFSNTRGV